MRTLTHLFREATHIKLRARRNRSGEEDLPWLRAVDHAIFLPGLSRSRKASEQPPENLGATKDLSWETLPAQADGTKQFWILSGSLSTLVLFAKNYFSHAGNSQALLRCISVPSAFHEKLWAIELSRTL